MSEKLLKQWQDSGCTNRYTDWLEAEVARLESQHHELLYAVATKFPDETRHETALRYIQRAENHDSGPAQQGVEDE